MFFALVLFIAVATAQNAAEFCTKEGADCVVTHGSERFEGQCARVEGDSDTNGIEIYCQYDHHPCRGAASGDASEVVQCETPQLPNGGVCKKSPCSDSRTRQAGAPDVLCVKFDCVSADNDGSNNPCKDATTGSVCLNAEGESKTCTPNGCFGPPRCTDNTAGTECAKCPNGMLYDAAGNCVDVCKVCDDCACVLTDAAGAQTAAGRCNDGQCREIECAPATQCSANGVTGLFDDRCHCVSCGQLKGKDCVVQSSTGEPQSGVFGSDCNCIVQNIPQCDVGAHCETPDLPHGGVLNANCQCKECAHKGEVCELPGTANGVGITNQFCECVQQQTCDNGATVGTTCTIGVAGGENRVGKINANCECVSTCDTVGQECQVHVSSTQVALGKVDINCECKPIPQNCEVNSFCEGGVFNAECECKPCPAKGQQCQTSNGVGTTDKHCRCIVNSNTCPTDKVGSKCDGGVYNADCECKPCAAKGQACETDSVAHGIKNEHCECVASGTGSCEGAECETADGVVGKKNANCECIVGGSNTCPADKAGSKCDGGVYNADCECKPCPAKGQECETPNNERGTKNVHCECVASNTGSCEGLECETADGVVGKKNANCVCVADGSNCANDVGSKCDGGVINQNCECKPCAAKGHACETDRVPQGIKNEHCECVASGTGSCEGAECFLDGQKGKKNANCECIVGGSNTCPDDKIGSKCDGGVINQNCECKPCAAKGRECETDNNERGTKNVHCECVPSSDACAELAERECKADGRAGHYNSACKCIPDDDVDACKERAGADCEINGFAGSLDDACVCVTSVCVKKAGRECVRGDAKGHFDSYCNCVTEAECDFDAECKTDDGVEGRLDAACNCVADECASKRGRTCQTDRGVGRFDDACKCVIAACGEADADGNDCKRASGEPGVCAGGRCADEQCATDGDDCSLATGDGEAAAGDKAAAGEAEAGAAGEADAKGNVKRQSKSSSQRGICRFGQCVSAACASDDDCRGDSAQREGVFAAAALRVCSDGECGAPPAGTDPCAAVECRNGGQCVAVPRDEAGDKASAADAFADTVAGVFVRCACRDAFAGVLCEREREAPECSCDAGFDCIASSDGTRACFGNGVVCDENGDDCKCVRGGDVDNDCAERSSDISVSERNSESESERKQKPASVTITWAPNTSLVEAVAVARALFESGALDGLKITATTNDDGLVVVEIVQLDAEEDDVREALKDAAEEIGERSDVLDVFQVTETIVEDTAVEATDSAAAAVALAAAAAVVAGVAAAL